MKLTDSLKFPILIDGGLSNVLEKNGHNLNHKLWSAKLLAENADAIKKVHLAYLNAGAQCLITSSYQASIQGLIDGGYNKTEAEFLLRKTTEIAEEAILETGAQALIAASIGPFGAFLADGSEYRGDYKISDEALTEFHAARLKVLETTSADLYACETIPSIQEAKVLAELLDDLSKPSWISFSCKDGSHISDGTSIIDCANILADHSNIFAIGINCTKPANISELINNLKASDWNKKIIVYPNSGEVFNAANKTWVDTTDAHNFTEMTREWLALGADMVGGCCRIGPDHIADIKTTLFTD